MKAPEIQYNVGEQTISVTWQVDPDDPTAVLQAVITEEGIILDAFEGDEHVGTKGMMADEWFNQIKEQ